MTETAAGSFIDVIEVELRKAVTASLAELRASGFTGY